MQKQTQKKAEKNVGTDAASDLCGAAPRAAGSVLLCHPRDARAGALRDTPLESRSTASWRVPLTHKMLNAKKQEDSGWERGAGIASFLYLLLLMSILLHCYFSIKH